MAGRSLFAVLPLALLAGSGCGWEEEERPHPQSPPLPTADPGDAGTDALAEDTAPEPDAPALDAPAADADLPADTAAPVDLGPPRRVLFVGNSYTEVNDLPAVVRALGAATGTPLVVESITPGGARFSDHWSSSGARDRIATGKFDTVVLQGQSLEPLENSEDFEWYGLQLSKAAHEAGAAAVFFATWARREGDPIYAKPGGENPARMTYWLEVRYRMAAEHNKDLVARVGAAWEIARAELPTVALHADDGSHPSPAGTLLAACVLLQSIAGQTPRVPAPPPLGLSRETANALCAIAPRVRCAEAMAFCGGACVDIVGNPDHCGGCGITCAPDDPCTLGKCGCTAGYTGCARRCFDLQADPLNCGACGAACAPGALCKGGACACPQAAMLKPTKDQLTALRPGCDPNQRPPTADCRAAVHRYCEALDCFDAGFGLPTGHFNHPESVMCVKGKVQATTPAALQAFVPTCAPATPSPDCVTAISRYCASTGAVTGFGPVESAGDTVTVTCLPGAKIVRATIAALARFSSRCIPHPVTCTSASWLFCQSLGHAGGFGPIEVAGTEVDVACLPQ